MKLVKKIKQPKNAAVSAQQMSAELVWKQTFAPENNARFNDVQKFIDSEVIRLMVPYTPMRNGLLMKVAVLGTKIGSGQIFYSSPYARYQYYGKVMVSSVTGSSWARKGEKKRLTLRQLKYDKSRHPKAQRMWFEAMKADKKEQLLRGAAAIAKKK